MERETQITLIGTLILAVAVLLQSTLLTRISIQGVKPDLALIVLVFLALRRGSMTGQVTGFLSGLAVDALSLSPLGFQAFIRTVLGFLYGRFHGTIFLDPVLMPMAAVMVATVLKALLSGLLMLLFTAEGGGFGPFGGRLWIEVGYNALAAPFVFVVLNRLKPLRPQREKDIL
jgi:rod shape-determining protein MreD